MDVLAAAAEHTLDEAGMGNESKGDQIVETDAVKAKRMRSTKHSCRVSGCTNALTLYYNWRYRICATHRKASHVEMNGTTQRFCQLCGKFQLVEEFVGTFSSTFACISV